MKFSLSRFVVCVLIVYGTTHGAVLADGHEAPNVVDAWYVTVKPGHDAQFVEAFKKHLALRKGKGDPRAWKVYSPVVGDHLDYYVIRHCCSTWADMDSYRAWSAEAGVFEDWNRNVDEHVARYRHLMGALDMANSNWPEDDSDYPYYGVTRFKPKMGQMRQVEAAKKELSDAAKAGNWPRYWSWGNQIGGKSTVYIVSPFKDYASMKPPEPSFFEFLSTELGSERKATAAVARFNDAMQGSSYTVYRRIDDMSMPD